MFLIKQKRKTLNKIYNKQFQLNTWIKKGAITNENKVESQNINL